MIRFALPTALGTLALVALTSAQGAAPRDGFGPGARVLVDAHNCYPDGGSHADRIDRALGTGLPIAIEQDLYWFRDPRSGVSRSIVSHGEPFTGTEPSLADHFFERIRPLVEQALRDDRRTEWPLIVLNLDLKSNEPEHHAAIWETLGRYESWLTTAARAADGSRPAPLDVKPVLVLTGSDPSQQAAFHDRVPANGRLRAFGAIAVDVEAKIGRGREAIPKLAGLSPDELIASGATNYRRWANFPWAVVERGGQAQAGPWTPEDAARLALLTTRAHTLGLWIRFYTLNGHAAADNRGWTASYNFGAPEDAEARWRAARDAGVDFIATDQYEGLARVLARPAAAQGAGQASAPAAAGAPTRPGVQGGGVTLLPNGWRIAPIGRHLQAGDFPLAMVAAPDRRYLIISNNGYSKPTLTIVDTERWAIKARVPVEHAWLGLAWDAAGKRLYSSGAAENTVQVFDYAPGGLKIATPIVVDKPALSLPPGVTDMAGTGFIGGLAMSRDGKTLYAVHVFGRAISAIDPTTGAVRQTVSLPAEPYTVLPAADGKRIFVSLWGGAKVLALDAATLATLAEVEVGEHPNAMALVQGRQAPLRRLRQHQPRVGARRRSLRRARADRGDAVPRCAAGHARPTRSRCRPTARRSLVANADNNTIALVDIEHAGSQRGPAASSRPAGIRPRCCFDHDRQAAVRAERQGAHRPGQPARPAAGQPDRRRPVRGSAAAGHGVGDRRAADAAALASATPAASMALSAYTDATKLAPVGAPADSPIPRRVGDPSPIKHVFYVIRENRTYDQVLGDIETGNGDPNLTHLRRGRDAQRARPGARVRAPRQLLRRRRGELRRPRLLDRRLRHRRRREAVADQLRPPRRRLPERGRRTAIATRTATCRRRATATSGTSPRAPGVSVRSYGEFADWGKHGRVGRAPRSCASVPGLKGLVHPAYPPYDLSHPRQPARRRLARGVSPLRGQRRAAAAEHHPPGQRPHLRHAARHADAAVDGGGERPRARPAGRGDQRQPLLEGVGDLRPRGRRAERARPRRLAPLGRPSSSARSRAAAGRSTARSTRRRACCARWS